jgi:hypothetical protein
MSSKSTGNEPDGDAMEIEGSEDGQPREPGRTTSPRDQEARRNSRPDSRSDAVSVRMSSPSDQQSPNTPYPAEGSRSQSGGSVTVASLLRPQIPEGTRPFSTTPIALTHDEALLVHHYTEYLGRWLDCTDATRQFTLGVPEKVKLCPVLCHAVLSFAARHRKDEKTAGAAYSRCIALLIDRLNEDTASHDETLLCAIVILRFYEQLSGGHYQIRCTPLTPVLTAFSTVEYRLR